MAPGDIDSLCLLIGSLHVTENLEPSFLARVIKKFQGALAKDELSLRQVAMLYLSLSRVHKIYVESTESAAFQTYAQLKGAIQQKVEKSEELDLDSIMILCLPLSLDNLLSEHIQKTFISVLVEKQANIDFKQWITVSQSFSMAGATDQRLWKSIEENMRLQLNENQGDLETIAGICFALENCTTAQISQTFFNKLQREISRLDQSDLNKNEQLKHIIE